MNSKTLRRLAADHSALHNQPLPPNYLFAPGAGDSDDLTQLDILLAGPTHTPFAAGVWKLHLALPTTYPQAPPTASFRTPIFHPNVDPRSGGVCVETLKRDWDARLSIRDVLVTICCLLIQPNPDSALNAEAGGLIQDDYASFERRARLMTSIHAVVPKELAGAVREAQTRGQEEAAEEDSSENEMRDVVDEPAAPAKRRRVTARQRGTAASRRSEGSPSGATGRRRLPMAGPSNPFVVQTDAHDPFSSVTPPPFSQDSPLGQIDEDSSMLDADQENDESRSPVKPQAPIRAITPRRPVGPPVPLGELSLDDTGLESSNESDDDDAMDAEYPPSPRKSPSKTAVQKSAALFDADAALDRAEGSRTAAARSRDFTPPINMIAQPLADDSPFAPRASPRKARGQDGALLTSKALATPRTPPRLGPGITSKTTSKAVTSSLEVGRKRKAELDSKLWTLCGEDIRRWNRGQFDGDVLRMKARRW